MPPDRSRTERRFRIWLLLLALLNVSLRLPLCWNPAAVTPDGAEYLAIARSLRSGGAYATDLKWQFYTGDPVIHAAWIDRPPLYPAFAAACGILLPGLDPIAAARLGNVLLAALAMVAAAIYLRRLFGPVPAIAAASYVFLLPHTLYWTTQPLTEALFLLLVFAVLALWSRVRENLDGHHKPHGAFAVGVLCGLAYLVRPTGALLLAALLLDLALDRRQRATVTTGGKLLVAFLCLAAPYHFMVWKTAGSPFASALGFSFAVRTIHDVTVLGFERVHPGTFGFLRTHAAELPALVLRQALSHAQGLLLPMLGLLPFGLLLRRGDFGGARRAGFAFALLLITAHTVTWSAKGSSRYFLPVLPLLVGLLLWKALGAERNPDVDMDPARCPLPEEARWESVARRVPGTGLLRTPRSRWLLLSASVLGLAVETSRFYERSLRADGGVPLALAYRAAAKDVQDEALIASDNPWMLNLLTGRPAIMLPRTGDPEKLARFAARYRPTAMVLFADEPEEAPMREAWRSGRLPLDWRLIRDEHGYLEIRPVQFASSAVTGEGLSR